jgi:hypothetical protein
MNESSLWDWLRDCALPLGNYSRIESPDTSPGFPDAYYTTEGHSGTIELKYARHKSPPFPNDETGLRKSQLRWIREEVRNGGAVWIFAEIPARLNPIGLDLILCIHGEHASAFNGASFKLLTDIATHTLFRKEPRDAARKLEEILRGPNVLLP